MATEVRTAAELREAISADLVAGGVKTLPYTAEAMDPPCASVVPSEPYLRKATGNDVNPVVFAGMVRLGFDVLLLVAQAEAKATAKAIDDLIWQAWGALDGWNRIEVAQPAEITPKELAGSVFLGSVITIEHDTKGPYDG